MTFVTTAGEIQAACKAGLQLVEENGRGKWMGTGAQWTAYLVFTQYNNSL